MDENRIMDKLDRIAEDCAAMRTDLKNQYQYITAVNENQKKTAEALQQHKESEDVHGVMNGRRSTDRWIQGVTVLMAAVGMFLGIKRGN